MTDPPRDWLHPATLAEATVAQREIAERVVREDRPLSPAPPGLVAGVDCSGAPRGGPDRVRALAVLLQPPAGGRPVTHGLAAGVPAFPYVPGFLGFREVPFVLDALSRLPRPPDLVFVDGHGISHPRGCGIAAHLGVLIDRPTIGVAKSILVGRPEGELGDAPGSTVPLVWKGRRIATVLRTKRRVQPVYVSIGHRVSEESAVRHVLDWLAGYRLPEPTRWADKVAGEARRASAEPSLL